MVCRAAIRLPTYTCSCQSLTVRIDRCSSTYTLKEGSYLHTYTMSLLRQSTQALRAAASASSSARWMSTSSVLRNAAHSNNAPAPTTTPETQGRDLAAEQLQRHEQAVTADLISSAPGTFTSPNMFPRRSRELAQ